MKVQSSIGLFMFLFFAVSTGFAQISRPTLLEGTYQYAGEYVIEAHRHSEVVVVRGPAGEARLEKLKSEGYSCIAKPSEQFLCSIQRVVDPANALVENLVKNKYTDYSVQFYKVVGAPSLDTNSESFKQWSVPQKIAIRERGEPDRLFSFANYVWSQGNEKVYPGGQSNPVHDMYLTRADGLEISWVIHSQPSRFEMDSYFVTVKLAAKP